MVEIEGHRLLLFSCNGVRLANQHSGQIGGIWVAPAAGPTGPFALDQAQLLVDETLYAGRLVQHRDGQWTLLAFEMGTADRPFAGRICDPVPVRWDGERQSLVTVARHVAAA
jgi:beta-fructofuranosidase